MSDLPCRPATHAGSWYSSDSSQLTHDIRAWIAAVPPTSPSASSAPTSIRAIIAPHAGYSYSGRVAGHAWRPVTTLGIRRVFVLGPSHKVACTGCHLSPYSSLSTPIRPLPVDTEVIKRLQLNPGFSLMSKHVDDREHSLELHYPFIAALFDPTVQLVPIMVGDVRGSTLQQCAAALSPFFHDPQNFFVISSDFCHWGQRFDYAPVDKTAVCACCSGLSRGIHKLDVQGMEAICSRDVRAFEAYLKQTGNTICGRNPILLTMQMLSTAAAPHAITFVCYAQSSECVAVSDSSVSYAAGIISAPPPAPPAHADPCAAVRVKLP